MLDLEGPGLKVKGQPESVNCPAERPNNNLLDLNSQPSDPP